MIKGVIVGAEEVAAKLKEQPLNLREELKIAIKRFSQNTVGYIKSSKLSGSPLQSHTNKLSGSINYRVEDNAGEEITGVIGTNCEYAAIHEYGFTGTESVKAHLRRAKDQRFVLKSGKYSKKKWAVGKSEGSIQVREFTRQMNMPERSFMRSSLQERITAFRNELFDATKRALKK